VLTAAVLEFSGAFMVGSHVSHTMQSGILTAGIFNGKDSLLFCGMLSSLGAAGTWLQVCNFPSGIFFRVFPQTCTCFSTYHYHLPDFDL
jgi:phosphate/sulfate permease